MVSFKLLLKYAYHQVPTEIHPGAFPKKMAQEGFT